MTKGTRSMVQFVKAGFKPIVQRHLFDSVWATCLCLASLSGQIMASSLSFTVPRVGSQRTHTLSLAIAWMNRTAFRGRRESVAMSYPVGPGTRRALHLAEPTTLSRIHQLPRRQLLLWYCGGYLFRVSETNDRELLEGGVSRARE